jgi:uncharacterized membrane protein YozB (DUF420 family)
MPRLFAEFPGRIFMIGMLMGSVLITAASLPYFDFETLPPFVIEKLPVRFESLWLASLRIHVASASLSFPLCLLLMTRGLRRRPAWHRRLGRFTGVVVLIGLVPSGVVLAFDAKGGTPVTVGFLLSAAIVASSMVHGVLAARQRDFGSHRRAMRHVVGQMSVAVTSRALILGLDAMSIDPDVAYVVALWGPVLGTAAIAELISLRSTHDPVRSFERNPSEVSTLARLLRIGPVAPPVARLGR